MIEQGTTNGVITDIEGNFTLTVNRGAKLEISYVGYKTRVIEVTDVTHLQITLEEDYRELEEVVVVGYGVQKKKLVTGATVQVKGDDVTKLNTTGCLGCITEPDARHQHYSQQRSARRRFQGEYSRYRYRGRLCTAVCD
ncbi:carboxypeptidase-like regulatory domain-containing protein [Bacteroides uniformis]|nr:carboxypeptidase-like regulatory domain-containing protein [Bacteroides uniformis]